MADFLFIRIENTGKVNPLSELIGKLCASILEKLGRIFYPVGTYEIEPWSPGPLRQETGVAGGNELHESSKGLLHEQHREVSSCLIRSFLSRAGLLAGAAPGRGQENRQVHS